MSAKSTTSWAVVVSAAVAAASGCTALQQAGAGGSLSRQTVAKAPTDIPVPPPDFADVQPSLGEASYPYSRASVEPGCEAQPFLREPGCAAPAYPIEPSCAAPCMPTRPCPPSPCPPKHEHVEAPSEQQLPQPQGCLAFGGGHISIPLPTVQFPGLFRVPAFRSALIPVAEPAFVGVATTPAVATERVVETAAPVRVVEEVGVAREALVVERDRALVLEEELRARLLEERLLRDIADRSGGQDRSAGGSSRCLCDEELDRALEIVREALREKEAAQPTPAEPSQNQAEIDELRSQVRQYQEEIDALIRDIKAQGGQD